SKILAHKRVDEIVADALVVSTVNNRLLASGELQADFVSSLRFAPVFEPTPYKMVFRNSINQKAFDSCFVKARDAGVIKRINDRYANTTIATFGGRADHP
ncbi:MAG: amino acid ABC transporter substrate-binding protein, partial [Pseudomonadales bacterium]|nr:amino acid ABC transporter substrate-binding protein [Pseudomonadales bacterium]